jgi:hypothetical protein
LGEDASVKYLRYTVCKGTCFWFQELQKLSAKRKAERESEKLLYQRMFNTSTDGNSKSPTDSKSAFKKSFNLAVVAGGVIIALAGVMAYRYVS